MFAGLTCSWLTCYSDIVLGVDSHKLADNELIFLNQVKDLLIEVGVGDITIFFGV